MSRTSPDSFEDDMERHESMRDREYLDEQEADRAAERAPLPDPGPRPLDRALDTADEATALAERLLDALTRISQILPPAGHPATAGQVTRARAVIAGLDRSEASVS